MPRSSLPLAPQVQLLLRPGAGAGAVLLAGLPLLLLQACSTTPSGSAPASSAAPTLFRGADGPPPPDEAPNPMSVPDAQPQVEPIRTGGANKPYEVLGQSYVPLTADEPYVEKGAASWYGRKFHGRRTASGETYNMYAMTAAHKTLPIPSYVRVSNPANGREVIVRVNDRGPFTADRVLDLSWAAAMKLGVQGGGKVVELRRLTNDEIRAGVKPADAPGAAVAQRQAPASPLVAAAPVRAPVATPSAPPARALTEAAAGFWLQLGAFSRSDGALQFHRRVADELDWLAPLLAVFAESGVHRLQAGPYGSREQASLAAERVRGSLSLAPVIVERR